MSTDDLTPENLPGYAAETDDRSAFIRSVYTHLFAAIAAFTGLEYLFFTTGFAEQFAVFALSQSWLAILGAFIVVSWIASHVAHKVESKPLQYLALYGFVVAEALIFVPMLYIALAIEPEIVSSAATFTLLAFAALTAIAWFSGRDFSFLRSFLMWGGVIALGTIVMGIVFGFELGTYFSMAMIGFAGASILYDTSKIMRAYPDDRSIAAALELFASVALMFWYVLRLFLARR
ncbi:MAG: Bax inhibitor-1 family protein [Pseudomonadota bacterium]